MRASSAHRPAQHGAHADVRMSATGLIDPKVHDPQAIRRRVLVEAKRRELVRVFARCRAARLNDVNLF